MKVILSLLVLLLVFPAFASAQSNLKVTTTVSESEEQIKAVETNSQITPQNQTARVNETIPVTIKLLGINSEPIASHSLSLKLLKPNGRSEEKSGISDVNGVYNFNLTAESPGEVKLEVWDTSFETPVKLLKEAQFSFTGPASNNSITSKITTFFEGILSLLANLFN